MICPRCETGTIINVSLKFTGEEAMLCDYCEAMWLKGDEIRFNNVRPIDLSFIEQGREFTIEESEDKDQDHRSANFTHMK